MCLIIAETRPEVATTVTTGLRSYAPVKEGLTHGAHRGRWVSARDQYLCSAHGELGGFRTRRRVAALRPRAGADRRRRRLQHPDCRRRAGVAGFGARAHAVVLVFRAALLLCRARSL